MELQAIIKWLGDGVRQNFERDDSLTPKWFGFAPGGDVLLCVPAGHTHPTDSFATFSHLILPLQEFQYVAVVVEAWVRVMEPGQDTRRGALAKMEAEGDPEVRTACMVQLVDLKRSREEGRPWGYTRSLEPTYEPEGIVWQDKLMQDGGVLEGALPDALVGATLQPDFDELRTQVPEATLAEWAEIMVRAAAPLFSAVMVMKING